MKSRREFWERSRSSCRPWPSALSLAAAFDLEAREHTYHELHNFLAEQRERLVRCSKLSLPRLVLETEMQLLAETANWFSRRSFTGVA